MEFKDFTENANSSKCTYDDTTERETRLSGLYDTLDSEKIHTEARCVKGSSKAIQYVKICKIVAILIIIVSLIASVTTFVVIFVPKESLESPESREGSCETKLQRPRGCLCMNENERSSKGCQAVRDVDNGEVVDSTGSQHGATAEIVCNDGYKLNGPKLIVCLHSGYWTDMPSCDHKTCESFLVPANTEIQFDRAIHVTGTEITVSCKQGFRIGGNKTVTCQNDETWSRIPVCIPVDCGMPPDIDNGKQAGLNATTYGNVFDVNCDEGYLLKGNKTVYCDSNGHWSSLPECKEISCGFPNIPRNASVVAIDGTTFDKSVSFQCLEGFVLKGSPISKCQSDGTWSEYPVCIADPCKPNPCVHGDCVGGREAFTCACANGFSGRLCDIDIDECTSSPCNTGSCIDGINKFTCSCPAGITGVFCQMSFPTDCYEIKQYNASTKNGVYRVYPSNSSQYLDVFCDMETNGGGWTVFQNRFDGSTDFFRNFANYTNGFGSLKAEFWLGLKYIQEMTRKYKTELRFDISTANGSEGHETFQNFNIGDTYKYILTFSNASGTIGDDPIWGLSKYLGCAFSTFDQDNDKSPIHHCAEKNKSGWWFNRCKSSDLNGPYLTPGTIDTHAMTFPLFTGKRYEALKTSKMMFRRV